jgi:hypothetical protein
MSDRPSIQTGRGIEGIAHLFLSQSSTGARPTRQKPGVVSTPLAEDPPPPQPSPPIENPSAREADHFGIALLADHLENHWSRIHRYGEQLADQYGKIAVVNVDSCEAGLIEIIENPASGGTRETLTAKPDDDFWKALIAEEQGISPSQTIAETEDFPNNLRPALCEFAQDFAEVILHIDKSYQKSCREMLQHCSGVVVLCSSEPVDIIETYKTIKWLAELERNWGEVFLFICDVPDSEAALETYNKLSQTCRNFLRVNLQYAGCSAAIAEKKDNNGKETPAEVPVAEKFAEPVQEPVSVDRASRFETQPMNQRPIPHSPIPVTVFPRQDAELADVLQLALPGWLGEIPTGLALPLCKPSHVDPAARVLIDATGRLHIMLASLTGSPDLFSKALQARKWLNENLNLIASHCPQLKIDRSLAAGLILIAPPPLEILQNGGSQIREFPILIKQLHLLLNEEKAALLIL